MNKNHFQLWCMFSVYSFPHIHMGFSIDSVPEVVEKAEYKPRIFDF